MAVRRGGEDQVPRWLLVSAGWSWRLLVIAAAVAAFLGVRAHIRQVRLIQSSAWAQVGRATVHASHRVH